MTSKTLKVSVGAVALVVALGALTLGEESKSGTADDNQAKYAEIMKKAGEPGENHALLARFEGTWEGVVTAYGPPGSPEMKGKTVGVQKMELGGRFLVIHFDGEFMGTPFSGVWTAGYNNLRKTFQATWMDNASSAIEEFEGSYDPATQTFTWKASMLNALTNTEIPTRETMKWTGKNTYLQEFFQDWGTGEIKTQQIEFTRVSVK